MTPLVFKLVQTYIINNRRTKAMHVHVSAETNKGIINVCKCILSIIIPCNDEVNLMYTYLVMCKLHMTWRRWRHSKDKNK